MPRRWVILSVLPAARTAGRPNLGYSHEDNFFEGSFTSINGFEGTWQVQHPAHVEPDDEGTFSGERIGGETDAIWRFTANYISASGDDNGLFIIDVYEDGNMKFLSYSLVEDSLSEPEEGTASVEAGTLSGTSASGTTFSASFDSNTGYLTEGMYSNSESQAMGGFAGGGCVLNPTMAIPRGSTEADATAGTEDDMGMQTLRFLAEQYGS